MIICYKKIGQKFRATRINMGLTQQELAAEAQLSPAFMGHIERGTRIPSLETAVKLCRVLGITMDSLLLGSVDDTSEKDLIAGNSPGEVKTRVRALLAMASWELDQME